MQRVIDSRIVLPIRAKLTVNSRLLTTRALEVDVHPWPCRGWCALLHLSTSCSHWSRDSGLEDEATEVSHREQAAARARPWYSVQSGGMSICKAGQTSRYASRGI
jgi:hypothetical protein